MGVHPELTPFASGVTHIFGVVACLAACIAQMFFFPHVKPFYWALTQITAWSLITHTAFFSFSAYLDAVGLRKQHLQPARDRWFTLCLTLAVGVAVFFFTILLPFTPEFLNISDNCSTPHDEDCISVGAFIVLVLANCVPAVLMAVEFVGLEHKLSYRNTYIEVLILVVYLSIYLAWTLICSAIKEDWPYTVQSKLEDNKLIAFGVHLATVVAFIGIYFIFRVLHARYWKPPAHFTDALLNSLEIEWRDIPTRAQEYEVDAFDEQQSQQSRGKASSLSQSSQQSQQQASSSPIEYNGYTHVADDGGIN